MARYIDADEGKKRLFSYYDCVNELTSKDNYHGETLMSYEVADMIEDCIENTPTADVQEVTHGRWEYVGNLANSIVYKCSVCGRCVSSTYPLQLEIEPSYPYCHCGAKMDGKE